MKVLPTSAQQKIARKMLHLQKASPKLLFIGGMAGFVGTTILACKATLKVDETLEETRNKIHQATELKHSEYSEEDRQKDLLYIRIRGAVALGKLYAPAIALGTISICALTKSHNILNKRNAALTAAYASVERAFAEYRKRVEEEYGDKAESHIRYATEEVKVKGDDGKQKTIRKPGAGVNEYSPYARFFDEFNRNYNREPNYNFVFLLNQQNFANDRLISRGHLFLNEVYEMLGMEHTSAGAVVGWVISDGDGDNFVDFGIFDGDKPRARDFVNGFEESILLDFNVVGIIYDKI